MLSDDETLDYGNISSAIPIKMAAELNCEIFYPSDAELTLDIDNDKDFKYFQEQYSRLKFVFCFLGYKVLKSRHGNRHVIIKLETSITDIKERILLQAILGSDRIREALSLLRVKRDDKHPSILLRPKSDK